MHHARTYLCNKLSFERNQPWFRRRIAKPRFRGCGLLPAVLFVEKAIGAAGGGLLPKKPRPTAIVEDDQFLRASLGRLMRSSGYTVEAFASAAEFLALPHLDEFACLIADINMPGITGLDLFRRLMAAGRRIPTILITAYPDDAARTRALNDGALCYLTKPFVDDDLMSYVRTAFASVKPPDETL